MAPPFDISERSLPGIHKPPEIDPYSRPDKSTTHHGHTLQHLSIWAYIALAFVIFALTVMILYACYSCCRSHVVRVEQTGTVVMRRRRRGWLPLKGDMTSAESQRTLLGVSRFSSSSGHTSHSTDGLVENKRPVSMRRFDEFNFGSTWVPVVAPERARTRG